MNVEIIHRLPNVSEFRSLRSGVSWGIPTAEQARDALKASLDGAIAVSGDQTIGMARLVGDGILNVYIQDVIVAQAFQSQGIGQAMISALIESLSQTCPPNCLIGLFAAEGQDAFYTRFGFKARPHSGYGPGMHAALSDLAKANNAA